MVQNMSCKIYMDHAATTEMLPQVRKAMEPYLMEEYGNASTSYEMGRRTREALEGAREQIAMLIKAKPEEIFFTSGGSESDNWVIKNVAAEKKEKGKHVITSKIEHHAVLRSCEYLEKLGYELTYLDVDAYGVIDLAQLREVLREDTTLVSVMTGNNEIGTIEPLDAVASMLRGTGTLFHTDAVQAIGQIPLSMNQLPVDYLSASAHKFHGPKGVGFLFVRKDRDLPSYIHEAVRKTANGQEPRMWQELWGWQRHLKLQWKRCRSCVRGLCGCVIILWNGYYGRFRREG
mgnify:CR=1 FL=1